MPGRCESFGGSLAPELPTGFVQHSIDDHHPEMLSPNLPSFFLHWPSLASQSDGSPAPSHFLQIFVDFFFFLLYSGVQ